MSRRRTPRRRATRAALTIGMLAVITGSAVIAVRSIRDNTQEAPFIVSADDKRVVVRSIDDGSEIRELASGRDARGIQRVVLSPDGKLVYFSRERPRRCPNWEGGNEQEMVTTDYSEIVRVATSGGPIEHVAWGQDPVMATNGNLFYLSSEGTSNDVIGYPCRADPIEFIRRLHGPHAKGPGKSVYSHNGPAPTIYPFTARQDGRALIGNHDPTDHDGSGRQIVFTMSTPPFPPEMNEDDVEGGGVARTTRAVTFPENSTDDSTVIAFIGSSRVAGTVGSADNTHLATFDPFDGGSMEKLFEVENDARVVPDKYGQDYLVLNQRGRNQEARRWSRGEGFVRIGTFPAGPVAWAGPITHCVPLVGQIPSAGEIAGKAASAAPSVVRTIAPNTTSCTPSPSVAANRTLRPLTPSRVPQVDELRRAPLGSALPEIDEGLEPRR